MRLYCPHCGVKGVADDSYRGKNLKCPKCKGKFVAEETFDIGETELPPAAPDEIGVAEGQAPGGEEEIATEPEIRGEETISVEAMVAGEEVEAEAPSASAPEQDLESVPEPAPEPEPAAVEEPEEEAAGGISPEESLEDEGETALDWDEIAAEVEANAAEEQRDDELPADLFAEMDDEEETRPAEESGVDVGETDVEVFDSGDRSAAWDVQQELPVEPEEVESVYEYESRAQVEAPAEMEPAAQTPAEVESSAGTDREDHFIFEEREAEPEPVPEVEDQPYGLIKEQCWQCGRKNRSVMPYVDRNGRFYCPDCLQTEESEAAPEPEAVLEPEAAPESVAEEAVPPVAESKRSVRFTIGSALRKAWRETRGAKGTIWAGSAIMYLVLIVLAAGGSLLLPGLVGEAAPDLGTTGKIAQMGFEVFFDAVSMLFSAGLVYMGIRKVSGDPISWRMIFSGFSDAGKIIVAGIFQSLLIFIGLLVLVLPGIYLAIGYSMTIPLIVDRKMSPWQAMETSRKAVHQAWWRVAGLYLVMGLLFLVSVVPLGIGLIWTWPMFVILAGVVYCTLPGLEK